MSDEVALTTEQLVLIRERQLFVQRRIRPQLLDPNWVFQMAWGQSTSMRLALRWAEMVCMVSMDREGRNLLSDAAWALIRKALKISLFRFNARIDVGSWTGFESAGVADDSSVHMQNVFIDFDRTSELALAGGWQAVGVATETIPEFGTRLHKEQAYFWLGMNHEGVDEDEDHEPPALVGKAKSIIVDGHEVSTQTELSATGGSPPLSFVIKTGPEWAMIDGATGRLTLTPGSDVAIGTYTVTVTVSDAGNRMDDFDVTVALSRNLVLDAQSISVPQGGSDTLQLAAYGGMAPYTYRKVSGPILVFVGTDGLVSIGFSADASFGPGSFPLVVEVTDAANDTVEATITIIVT